MELDTATVFDRAASSYERAGPALFSHFGRLLVGEVGVAPDMTVLDVACGNGAVMRAASERMRESGLVVGIDLSPGMLAQARRAMGGRPSLARMDAQRLAFAGDRFDRVLCGFALCSFQEPAAALREFCRALRAKGRLGLTVSEGWWWEDDPEWVWHSRLLADLIASKPSPRRYPLPEDLAASLTTAGLTEPIVRWETFALVFSDVRDWWAWAWSHGWRGVLESLNPAQLDRYRDVSWAALGQDKPIVGKLKVLIATASAPH